MPEQQRHQLGAEARERQAAAPLDDQLDDVAREDEHERDEHREVGGGQRVEDELRGEIRRERGDRLATVRIATSAADEDGDAGENQPRVVAERTPTARRRRGCRHAERRGEMDVTVAGMLGLVSLTASDSVRRLQVPTPSRSAGP